MGKYRHFRFKFNDRGIGLLEVVIAAGIMSIVMLGFANVMTFQTRGAHSVEKDLLYNELVSDIEQVQSNSSACASSFTNQSAAPGTHMVVHFGQTLIQDNTQSGYTDFGVAPGSQGGIKITDLTLSNVTGVPLGTPGLVQADMTLTADLQGTNGSPIIGGATRPPFVFHMMFNVGPSQNITSCGGVPGITQIASSAGCTTPAGGGGCQTTVVWPTPFTDNNYVSACSLVGVTNIQPCVGGFSCMWIASTNQTPAQVQVNMTNGTNSEARETKALTVQCIGFHP